MKMNEEERTAERDAHDEMDILLRASAEVYLYT